MSGTEIGYAATRSWLGMLTIQKNKPILQVCTRRYLPMHTFRLARYQPTCYRPVLTNVQSIPTNVHSKPYTPKSGANPRDLDLKALIIDAYEKGRLIAVVPFVAKILETCNNSRIFCPPNPWTMLVLSLLAELHPMEDLKLNIKFEIPCGEVIYGSRYPALALGILMLGTFCPQGYLLTNFRPGVKYPVVCEVADARYPSGRGAMQEP
eukprot:193116-Rhodomonas_salina.5